MKLSSKVIDQICLLLGSLAPAWFIVAATRDDISREEMLTGFGIIVVLMMVLTAVQYANHRQKPE